MKIIDGLSDVANSYDALICDVWGVVHNGRAAFEGAVEALTSFRKARGPVVLLTNAPRPSRVIPEQLSRLGAPADAYDAIVTSGDATTAEIAKRAPGPVYHLGPDKDHSLFDGVEVTETSLEKAAFILCTGLVDDQTETPDDYQDLLSRAKARNLDMICANPDVVVKFGDRLIFCGGALAQLYQTLGGTVVYVGKPHSPIYDLAYAALERAKGAPVARDRILAIGDGLHTDIEGANNQKLDALFVASGIHGDRASGADGRLSGEILERTLAHENLSATAAMTELRW